MKRAGRGQRSSPRAVRAFALIGLAASLASAGPIDVYRDGPRFCPRDRDATSEALTQAQAIERARSLLPGDFCGPTTFVSGCDVLPEYATGSWRIYFHQYRMRDARRDWGGLTHTYIVLDPVGNCFANIPGTPEGAPR